ncbi:MAG: SpoIIE family protein phosphatase [SAR324 cluster bacterium]|nr:SpoIIE family protein phosphatase [SAR324 cluster bacterium]
MSRNHKILIVDDSKFIRLTLRQCLESYQITPINVTEAYDGVHALEILASQEFDLILTDLEMPRMNGLGLISELRKQNKFDDVPIIFLTSVDSADVKVSAFQSGATDYVVKPFTAEELIARIIAHLERKFMTEAIQKKAVVSESLTYFYRRLRSINLEELYNIIVVLFTQHFKVGSVALWEYENESQILHLKVASDSLPAVPAPQTRENKILWGSFQASQPVVSECPSASLLNNLGFSSDIDVNSPLTFLPLFMGETRLGVLNLANFPSDFFSNYELTHLESIQHYLSNALQNAFSFRVIQEKQRQTNEELEQAKSTQLAILPQTTPVIPFMKIATKYVSMEQIGGDLYDIFEFDEENVGVLVADVTGHGIPAALISCMSSSLFNAFASKESSPEKVLTQVNDELTVRMPEAKFVTAFYATYDSNSQIFSYAVAGHPEAYVIRESGEVIGLADQLGLPLGIFSSDISGFGSASIKLQKNDRIFLYTDGIVEIANPEKEMFGANRLQKFLLESKSIPLNEMLDKLYSHALSFSRRSSFDDDITLLAFDIH